MNAFVIAASATCSACLATKSFDEEVYEYATARKMPMYYVFSDKPDNREREQELISAGRTVIRVKALEEIGLTRVPTLARIDHRGVIQSRWTGTIPDGQRDSVFASITSGSGMQTYQRINSSEMQSFVVARHAQVLAFSEPNAAPTIRAKIIPPSEVYVRAKHEMDPNVPIVVDCATTRSAFTCQDAGLNLSAAHFREIVLSGLPRRSNVCPSD